MTPKEQLTVDERTVCRERRDQIKGQEGAKNAQKKVQRNTFKKGEGLINSKPGSSKAQRQELEEVELIKSNLIPTPDNEENDKRVKEVEEGQTNSPMTLTPQGRTRLALNKKDGEDPLVVYNRLSDISQSSGQSFVQSKIIHSKPNNE
eukprot:Gb_38582 [translate_table: standard]